MEITLSDPLKQFVRSKVESGEFVSEQAVIETALQSLQEQEAPRLANLIDHEFVAFCEREGDDQVTLEDALRATSRITGSMARSIIDDERADRF